MAVCRTNPAVARASIRSSETVPRRRASRVVVSQRVGWEASSNRVNVWICSQGLLRATALVGTSRSTWMA